MSRSIQIGDYAPDFVLKDQHGNIIKLSDYRDQANVVLYFYPKDDTPGCTAEACGFRDHYTELKEAGAEVIGISSDDSSSHFKFAAKFNLPFILLSDTGAKVRRLYNVPNNFLFIPGRVTFIIDKKGVVRHIFNSQLNAMKHVEEAKKILEKI
jgi:thioredoxin-dependent peroxiredoxin